MNVGRPTVITEDVLRKLEEAFSYGATDKEAIFIADISSTAFYDYCKENPDFAERKEALKDMPKYQARVNIVKKIKDGDVPTSQWYAERKVKEEFSTRSEVTGNNGEGIIFNVVKYGDTNSVPLSTEGISDTSPESTG